MFQNKKEHRSQFKKGFMQGHVNKDKKEEKKQSIKNAGQVI